MCAKGLGKGFGSLLPDNFDNSVILDNNERVHKILIQDIVPDKDQPRRIFDEQAINELSSSIKRYGILQPIVVTKAGDGYMIIAGERRYHAAKKAGLTHLPALVRTMEDLEKLEVGLIENMQRVDLSPLEQAMSIKKLNEQFSVELTEIANRLGKSEITLINTLRLLNLPDFAIKELEKGNISEGHARTVLSLKGHDLHQKKLIDNIKTNAWSVRQAEDYVKRVKDQHNKLPKKAAKTADYSQYEESLSQKTKSQVTIKKSKSKIIVKLTFKNQKDFESFL